MSKCNLCGNEKIGCICPKSLGSNGAGESKDVQTDAGYDDVLMQVANALLKQYTDIFEKNPSKLSEFIDSLREILDDESAGYFLELLEEGIATSIDRAIFLKRFKSLNPNMAMLDALSHQFGLGVFPSPANQFLAGIKTELQKLDGWLPYPDTEGGNFEQALLSYAAYYQRLSPEKQAVLSNIFWLQINQLGTPIIESNPKKPSECNVYFLLPKKDKMAQSKEVPGTTKDLYLQGDIHGYDTTRESSRVTELGSTGIMFKQSVIPKDAIITYRYVQLEPSLRDKTPVQHHGSEVLEVISDPKNYFPNANNPELKTEFVPVGTPMASDQFWGAKNQILDDNSRHRPHYFGFSGTERIFRVNPNPDMAHLPGKQIEWSSLLSKKELGHFKHRDTFYSTVNGEFQFTDDPLRPPDEGPDSLRSKPQYSDCTRAIHVFEPSSGKVDNLVILNDGFAYLLMDIMDKFNKMVELGTLSPNTAFVFVTALPGLSKTMTITDPKAALPGMGERTIDYEYGIEEYVRFLREDLLPLLDKSGLNIPKEPERRVMIGSSMSGTASIYIGSKHPDLIGTVIAQSPTPANRKILTDTVNGYDPETPRAQIHLSCGKFEQEGFADNANLPFAVELGKRIHLPLKVETHGHQHLAWTEELTHSLPAALPKLEMTKNPVKM